MRKFILGLLLFLVGCAHHVQIGQPVGGNGFSYVKYGEFFYLFARNDAAYRAGVQEICKDQVCEIQLMGEFYMILVTPK